jgi:hypothetical protein
VIKLFKSHLPTEAFMGRPPKNPGPHREHRKKARPAELLAAAFDLFEERGFSAGEKKP